MPLIQVDTSCDVSGPDKKQSLAKLLSRAVAEGTGKPEQYVMTCVRDNMTMTMGGQADPCALVAVKGIGGLGKAVNQDLSGRIAQALKDELAIPADRVYLTFEELDAQHWGWKGSTFG